MILKGNLEIAGPETGATPNPLRRRLLQGSAALLLAHITKYASAESDAAHTVRQISRNVREVENLRRQISGADFNAQLVDKFQDDELALRQNLGEIIASVRIDCLGEYVLQEQRDLYDEMLDNNISVRPEPEQLEETPVPQLECDSIQQVLVEIILEALGMRDAANVIQTIIDSSEDLQQLAEKVGEAIKVRDWEKLVDLLVKLSTTLRQRPPPNVIEKIGEKAYRDFRRTLLGKLALRFVPFVGWVYLAASLALAVYRNMDRLTDCPAEPV